MGVAAATFSRVGRGAVEESEEARLVSRCRRGDREAQEALVRRYQEKVYRLAHALLGHPEEALDACQEALVAMLRSLPTYQGAARFSTWLHALTVKTCLMHRRSLRIRTRIITDAPPEDYPAPSPWIDPEGAALSAEVQTAVREHLRRLPAEFRAAVVLREMEGLSYDEIADTLKIPLGTVQSRLNRGRELLRKAFLADARVARVRPGGARS